MHRKLIYPILFLLSACVQGPGASVTNSLPADTIFIGNNIITMENDSTPVSAVAVRGDKIVAIGETGEVMDHRGVGTRVVELGDKALLPGFVDAHGHFSVTARVSDFLNLSSPPVGAVGKISDIVRLLRERVTENEIPAGEWVVGYGYDESLLDEKRHPTRDDLDEASAQHPILLIHVSGHLAATNSVALRQLKINANTPNPKGGVIRRREGSLEPNGVFEESAASKLLIGQLGRLTGERFIELTRGAALQYASYGVTTVQDGAIMPGDLQLLREAAKSQPYKVDVGTYTYATVLTDEGFLNFSSDNAYDNGVRQIGVKFSLDGSPQGRTAWMTQPYTEGPPDAPADYVAYPTFEPDVYRTRVADLIQRGIPVLVHANGDAAIDLMIEGVAGALENGPVPDHRAVAIHSQLMREDQVKRAAELGIVASFFSAHPFYWGDWHRVSFGDKRAQNISPTRWAIDNGLAFTLHNDAPIVPPDMMRLLWATVNRTTRSGHILGPEQRLTVSEALHALTLGGAYQFFEEDLKGSLRVGKLADLVVLEFNPLKVDPTVLKDIRIVETISRGRSVYRNPEF